MSLFSRSINQKVLCISCITIFLTLLSSIASASDSSRSGKVVYDQFCAVCHSIGVAGAPRFGNINDWAPRIDKGMDSLLDTAINGINAMPPRGLCNNCSNDEIQESIKYIIENSK